MAYPRALIRRWHQRLRRQADAAAAAVAAWDTALAALPPAPDLPGWDGAALQQWHTAAVALATHRAAATAARHAAEQERRRAERAARRVERWLTRAARRQQRQQHRKEARQWSEWWMAR